MTTHTTPPAAPTHDDHDGHDEHDDQEGLEATLDVLVVGGGVAGLSGALALGRAGRRVLVLDAGEPRNAPAAAVHNLLGQEGTAPGDLLARGRAEVEAVGGEVRRGRAVSARRLDGEAGGHDGAGVGGFVVTTEDGAVWRARRLLLATGLVDELPDLPGLREHWGESVLHCPYCHGHEVRDQRLVVLASSELSTHQALLWRQWSASVTLLVDPARATEPAPAALERLVARGVAVVRGGAVAVEGERGALLGVRLDDGRLVEADAVVVAPRFSAREDLLAGLGLGAEEVRAAEVVVGTAVTSGSFGSTPVPGVRVAGNLTDVIGQVTGAMTAGTTAGAGLNAELVEEDTERAVAAARAEVFERPAWEERYEGAVDLWSGRPNVALEAEATDLAPGRALDVGCGEGGDALWLAARGWEVTGMDFARSGLDRARARAEAAGLAARTSWRRVDVRTWEPGDERWDLVTAHFVHLPDGGMVDVVRRLASAVAPGGHLLVVGHQPVEAHEVAAAGGEHAHHDRQGYLHTVESLLPALDAGWEVEVAEVRPREQRWTGEDGVERLLPVRDGVLRARRTSPGPA